MLHPRFRTLSVTAAAAALFLFAAGADAAGKGGGGGHGGGGGGHGGGHAGGGAHMGGGGAHMGGVSHVGGAGAWHGNGNFHNGNFHNGNFHNFDHHHGNGFGVFIGPGWGWGYGGWGYGYPYYDYGYGAGVGPAVYNYNADYYSSNYLMTPAASQASASPGQQTPPADDLAHVQIKVPADAEVWFGTGKTSQTGATREFVSPPLTPGQQYTYDIRVRWLQDGKEMAETRQIVVGAGMWKGVDFTRPQAEAVEPPKPSKP